MPPQRAKYLSTTATSPIWIPHLRCAGLVVRPTVHLSFGRQAKKALLLTGLRIHEDITDQTQPCCIIRSISRLLRVASNAPFTSTVRIEAVSLFSREYSISCVRQARRSEAVRVGRPPACYRLTTLYKSLIFTIRLVTSLSRPFPRQERSAIGR